MHLIPALRSFIVTTASLSLLFSIGCASHAPAITGTSTSSAAQTPGASFAAAVPEASASDPRIRRSARAQVRPTHATGSPEGSIRPAALQEIPDGAAEERRMSADGLALSEEDAEGDEADLPGEEPAADEAEAREAPSAAEALPGVRYTNDLSESLLSTAWRDNPGILGAISVGFVDEGRLINALPFPQSPAWKVVNPRAAWATEETIGYLTAAISRVKSVRPDAPPIRINSISVQHGGYLPPHKSHQSGRDVDLGFYYPTAEPIRVRAREKYIDVALNWELIKSLVTLTDVQLILVDRRVKKVLYDHALRSGEDKAWLDSLFYAGRRSLIRHARRHRDHFHVRFYNPRAQELGRRIAPLLAQRRDQNVVMYRVRSGDTLGAIAAKYSTTVSALKKANGMRRSFLKVGQVLKVKLRGPCTRCPVPPPVVVPERRLPPVQVFAAAPVGASR